MSGLVSGFATGFGITNQLYQQEENNKMRKQAMGLQMRQDERAEESHNVRMDNAGLQQQVLQDSVDNLVSDREHKNSVRALELDTAQYNNKLSKVKLGAAQEQDRKAKALDRFKTYYASGDWSGFLDDKSFAGTDLELLQNPHGAQSAIALEQSLVNNDVNGIVQHANTLYKSKLNRNVGKMKGRDGGVIRDISIIGFELQDDGTAKMPVSVTTDKGQYTSYISEMRGIDPNDKEKVVTVDELFGRAAGLSHLAGIMQSSGIYDQMNKSAGLLLGTSKGSQPTAKQREWATIQQLFGPEKLQEYIFYSRQENPQTAYQNLTAQILKDLQSLPQNMRTPREDLIKMAQQSAQTIMQQSSQQQQQQAGVDPKLAAFQQWLQSSQQGQ